MDKNSTINYVLIDLENVQPNNLDILIDYPFRVFVFVGANQTKINYDMAVALQKFGNNAQYIKISAIGPNALDFHIAFYIGQLSIQDPRAYFHIISKDKGYDPLIKHLRERKVRIQREKELANIPILKRPNLAVSHNKTKKKVKLKIDTESIKLLRNATMTTKEKNGWSKLSRISTLISNHSSFDHKDYGYASLSDLINTIEDFELRQDKKYNFILKISNIKNKNYLL